tara:strand:+ start:1487 stop:2080 length:594 start_codon:yes stop_codon:yes gene_type:complete
VVEAAKPGALWGAARALGLSNGSGKAGGPWLASGTLIYLLAHLKREPAVLRKWELAVLASLGIKVGVTLAQGTWLQSNHWQPLPLAVATNMAKVPILSVGAVYYQIEALPLGSGLAIGAATLVGCAVQLAFFFALSETGPAATVAVSTCRKLLTAAAMGVGGPVEMIGIFVMLVGIAINVRSPVSGFKRHSKGYLPV